MLHNTANLFHGRFPLSEICNDLILARLMPSGAVHSNRLPYRFQYLRRIFLPFQRLDKVKLEKARRAVGESRNPRFSRISDPFRGVVSIHLANLGLLVAWNLACVRLQLHEFETP